MTIKQYAIFIFLIVLNLSCTEGVKEEDEYEAIEVADESDLMCESPCEGAEMACETGDTDEEVITASFDSYLNLYEEASLPITINSFKIDLGDFASKIWDHYKEIREKSGFNRYSFNPYCRLNTKTGFIVLISFEQSYLDLPAPIIETYTAQGELIDLQVLDFKYEPSESSSTVAQSTTINTDLSFTFTLEQEEYDLVETVDDEGNYSLEEGPNGPSLWRILGSGEIDSDGKIILEKENAEQVDK